jgi:hypothetical protein
MGIVIGIIAFITLLAGAAIIVDLLTDADK